MPRTPLRILLLNFTPDAALSIRYYAERESWVADEGTTRPGYLRKINSGGYALIVLDTTGLKQDSFRQCAAIKRVSRNIPVVLVTSERGISERLTGFQAGADDCVSKPFSPRELLCRMKAILGRIAERSGQPAVNSFSNRLLLTRLEIERNIPLMRINRLPVPLSLREYELLKYLAARSNRTVTREELLQEVWHSKHIGYLRTVDTNIKRIREKLKHIDPHLAGMIRTERGNGYRLMDPSVETV